jgi:hypothetical protein
MIKDSLKLEGRVTSVSLADQSFLIETKIGEHKNRRYVYANDALFKKLSRTIEAAQFQNGKGLGMTGIFYIQGKVLMRYSTSLHNSWKALFSFFTGAKPQKAVETAPVKSAVEIGRENIQKSLQRGAELLDRWEEAYRKKQGMTGKGGTA